MKTLIKITALISIIFNYNILTAEKVNSSNTAADSPNLFHVGPTAGITIGTPGYINIETGYQWENYGIQFYLSGLTYLYYALLEDEEESSDFNLWISQINFSRMILNNKNYFIAASILFGVYHIAPIDNEERIKWIYGGISAQFCFKGLFIELGITYGHDADKAIYGFNKNFAPIYQIGYIMRL